MSRRSVVAGSGLVLLAACSSNDNVGVRVGPSILMPAALLDNVSKLTLTVVDTSGNDADCDTSTGVTSGDLSQPILTKDLASSGCANGAKFCGDLQITESDHVLVFAAAGYDGNGNEVATGCGKATVNQDALPVQITMKRFISPSNCGDGTIQATEQCDPAGGDDDQVCDDSCHTKEIYLSGGHGGSGNTAAGLANQKKNPTFVWPATSGDGGRFVALFSDSAAVSFTKVTMRVLGDDLEPYTKQGAEMAGFSFYMPHDPGEGFPPSAGANNQAAPSAASVGGKTYIAFNDDSSGTVDVALRGEDSLFAALQANPLAVNGAEAGKQDLASMAANASGTILVEWEDAAAGAIKAKTYDPSSGAFGSVQTISDSAGSSAGVIASNGSGWVAAWQAGSDIKYRTIGADGTPLSAAVKVNDGTHSGQQAHPWIAGLPDGRFAIVWNDRTSQDVFLQRYSASGTAVAGDQSTALNNLVTEGDQNAPTITACTAGGGSFVAAWADGASGQIKARFPGGSSGFLFNNVDGQSDEFQASVDDAGSHNRQNPAAVVGGSGPFVAIGWEDQAGTPGIYVRRFPLPSSN